MCLHLEQTIFGLSLAHVTALILKSSVGGAQVIELAAAGAAAVSQWMKAQLLDHVQKLAICQDAAR